MIMNRTETKMSNPNTMRGRNAAWSMEVALEAITMILAEAFSIKAENAITTAPSTMF